MSTSHAQPKLSPVDAIKTSHFDPSPSSRVSYYIKAIALYRHAHKRTHLTKRMIQKKKLGTNFIQERRTEVVHTTQGTDKFRPSDKLSWNWQIHSFSAAIMDAVEPVVPVSSFEVSPAINSSTTMQISFSSWQEESQPLTLFLIHTAQSQQA